MTASEFAFLSLGLVLGILTGAALVEVLRSRPPAPREIRLTVTPDSVPRRRASTLSEDAFVLPGPEPAHGGPGDRRQTIRAGEAATGRTGVRSPLGPAGAGDPSSSLPLSRFTALPQPVPVFVRGWSGLLPSAIASGVGAVSIAVPVRHETDWTLQQLRSAAAGVAERALHDQRLTIAAILEPLAAGPRGAGASLADGSAAPGPKGSAAPGTDGTATAAAAADADPVPDPPSSPAAAAVPGPPSDASGDAAEGSDDNCSDVKRVAEERCAVANIARTQAETAHDALRAAQRAYDDHHARSEEAALATDPRAIRTAKDAAQQAFRGARAAAASPDAVETAARDWLTEINRINRAARDAGAVVVRERESANALVTTIERLTVDADAARIAAESANAACLVAREAVAECQEAAATRASTSWPRVPGTGTGIADDRWGDESELEAAFTATGAGEPAILRLLRGDRATLGRLVGQLAGEDPAERRRWQLALAGLVDALIARSIEASALTFPLGHPFWAGFSQQQNRDIVAALSSLGYRFDGLGGWADGRVPTQRDLSLAVGYAGLDPMRIRPWPTDDDLATLFREVVVAADEYLADAAGGLTLGELVTLLGRRADSLADLWNEWGRVRPLLLAGGS